VTFAVKHVLYAEAIPTVTGFHEFMPGRPLKVVINKLALHLCTGGPRHQG